MVDREGFIHSCCVSKWYTRDGSRVPHLLKGIDGEIDSLTGDKGYDQNSVYKAVRNKNKDAVVIIHPRSNAVISGNNKWTQRDRHVHNTRRYWVYIRGREAGYYQQSNVENTFYQYKTTIGRKVRARTENGRDVKAKIACKILNRLLDLGMATPERVA